MEYTQMTLDEWVNMKKKLRQELLGVKQSFVRIGYALRKIEDQKLYERDGYKSIGDFAKEEYGLEPSTTSRFMSINREYSIDGYSDRLRPEYAELGRSQLEEMLKLPEEDRQMVQPETSRENIRELKRFNKTEPAAGEADDLKKLIEQFYKDNPEILNAVFQKAEYDEQTINQFAEIVNPSGNRSYKKGLYFLMMYENRVAVKKFGSAPEDITWMDFWKLTEEIFEDVAAGPDTWTNFLGEPENGTGKANNTGNNDKDDMEESHGAADQEERETPKDCEDRGEGTSAGKEEGNDVQKLTVEGKEPEEHIRKSEVLEKSVSEEITEEGEKTGTNQYLQIAPAQKTEDISEKKVIPDMNPPEIIEKPFGSRKDYWDTLTIYGMAEELSKTISGIVQNPPNKITDLSFWENYLSKEVDDQGREIEEG